MKGLEAPAPLRIADASFVTGQLLTGGDLDIDDNRRAEAQLAELVARGLTHIVDVRIEWSDQYFVSQAAPGVRYLHLGIDDAGQQVPDEFFDRGVGFIRDALTDPSSLVLAHCHMGINRGPSLAYAVLLDAGVDPVAALDQILAVRPVAYIAYAEDALRWHHRRTGASAATKTDELAAIDAWRLNRRLDLAEVIRRMRQG
jgi:dual specificity phosphatase 3